jgi:hypothetical protein
VGVTASGSTWRGVDTRFVVTNEGMLQSVQSFSNSLSAQQVLQLLG